MNLPLLLLASLSSASPQVALPSSSSLSSQQGAFYWSDFNADGHTDAYVVLPEGRAKLLAGSGEGRFRDVTREYGLDRIDGVHQVQWADFNQDGRVDLFLASWQASSQLLLQDEGGSFQALPDPSDQWSSSQPLDVRAFDYDGDRITDLQLVTPTGDRLLRGVGDGRFEAIELGFVTASAYLPGETTWDVARRAAGLADSAPGTDAPDSDPNLTAAGGAISVPTPDSLPAGVFCPPSMEDSATGNCLPASSTPMLGALYPLGNEFFIEAGSGQVGIGTTTPGQALDVIGSVRASGRLISGASSGAPLVVQSTSRVNNLNADLLDGFTASDFSQLGGDIDNSELANNAVTTNKIAPGAVESTDLATGSVTVNKLADNSVSGAKIQNGTITNSDVSASANISGAKINPDFSGKVVRGQSLLATGDIEGNRIFSSFGNSTTPTIRFSENEAAGLSSPSANTLNLIAGSVSLLRLLASGAVEIGSDDDLVVTADGRTVAGNGFGEIYQKVWAQNFAVAPGGTFSSAVRGINEAPSGLAIGVSAVAESNNAIGVNGFTSDTTGTGYGVRGDSNNPAGAGVRARSFHSGSSVDLGSAQGFGVTAFSPVEALVAIRGQSTTTGSYGDGVHGIAAGSAGYGVWGINNEGGFGVFATGNMGATGTKSFVAPHPVDPATEIRFICLEGNEAGTYFRGSSQTSGGIAIIEVPEEFRHVTDEEGLTVQLTARGPGQLWVESEGLEQIVVRSTTDVEFHYFVNGVRRGFEDVEILAENRSYRPTEAGLPFGADLPAEVRQLLVENGILNADFTPNEATAARLGWELAPRGTQAELRAQMTDMTPLPPAIAAPEPAPETPR